METFSALLAICAGNSPVPGEFPAQRPVTRSFNVFFDLCLNKRLSKQSWGCWFETLPCPLWRHCNVQYGAAYGDATVPWATIIMKVWPDWQSYCLLLGLNHHVPTFVVINRRASHLFNIFHTPKSIFCDNAKVPHKCRSVCIGCMWGKYNVYTTPKRFRSLAPVRVTG